MRLPDNSNTPSIVHGDSLKLLRKYPDNTFDHIVTDPPYELNFGRIAGRTWDGTGIAFDPTFWAECLRVLKPGGNLLAFAAPRTHHRIAVAIEDAGFEVRDDILAWVKSSGFPKSKNLPKLLGDLNQPELSQQWQGMGTAFKPAHEPIIVARKAPVGPLPENIVEWGVGGLNIDAMRVPTDEDRSRTPGEARRGDILNLQRGGERSISHEGGRFPTNMILVHREECTEETCDEDCAALELENQKKGSSRFFPAFFYHGRAARSERPVVNGVEHLSVKPLGVMEWLVTGAAMPGQLILDPFAGSGATVEAAMRHNIRCVALELGEDYIPLIKARVAREQKRQTTAR